VTEEDDLEQYEHKPSVREIYEEEIVEANKESSDERTQDLIS